MVEERRLRAEGRAGCEAVRQHSESSQGFAKTGALNGWKRKAGKKLCIRVQAS